jgi:hypothetical protein
MNWCRAARFYTSVRVVVIWKHHIYIYRGKFVSPSEISDLCGTVTGMVTPKRSMSTGGETLQISVLPYRCSICPSLVWRQMSMIYSSSCHTLCSVWLSIAATASTILCHSCGKSLGIGGKCVRAPMPPDLPRVAGT